MNLNQLFEELAKAYKKGDIYYQIFKNPSFSEMKDLKASYGRVRFAIDKRGKRNDFYVWDSAELHRAAAKRLGIPYPHEGIFYGVASYSTHFPLMADSNFGVDDMLSGMRAGYDEDYNFCRGFFGKNWSNRYVDISELFANLRTEYADALKDYKKVKKEQKNEA